MEKNNGVPLLLIVPAVVAGFNLVPVMAERWWVESEAKRKIPFAT